MSNDPFSSLNPSDRGLNEGVSSLHGPAHLNSASARQLREEYDAPAPSPVDADAPEESLRDVPLPEGFLKRMRRFVDEL